MNNNQAEGARWLAQAQHDIRAAALTQREKFPEIACFLAQQAAEKGLKAFLYTQGERPVLGHATHLLLPRCAEYDETFAPLLDLCRQLDQYYISTRYPNGVPDGIPHDVYTDSQAAQAVAAAQKRLAFVEKQLKK